MTDESGRFRRRFLQGAGAAAATALAGCAGGDGGSTDGSTPTDQGSTPEGTETQTDEEVSGTPTDTEGTGGQEQTATRTEEFPYGDKSPAAWAMGMQPSNDAYGNLTVSPIKRRGTLVVRAADIEEMDKKGISDYHTGLSYMRNHTPFKDSETNVTASDEIAYRLAIQLTPKDTANRLKENGWEEVESELDGIIKWERDEPSDINTDINSVVIHQFLGGSQVHAGKATLPHNYDIDSSEMSFKALSSEYDLSNSGASLLQEVISEVNSDEDYVGARAGGGRAYGTKADGTDHLLFDR